MFFVRLEEIDKVEAADNYASLPVGSETHLVRETMKLIEGRLDAKKFLRIHRSTIVNPIKSRSTYREKILAVPGT